MSLTRLNILVQNSSLPEELRTYILELEGDIIEINGLIMNKWDYLEMHQLEPITQRDPQNLRDINKRLDTCDEISEKVWHKEPEESSV